MKNKKTVTDKTIAANQANARKSTGPKTGGGKNRARLNALKTGFFAKELHISEEDRREFEDMRDSLAHQYAPAMPMQEIAFDQIVCGCWRCRLALRMENWAVVAQQNSRHERKVEAPGAGEPMLLEAWYGCDHRSLQNALRFLRDLRADVAHNGLQNLEQDGRLKESVIKGFGQGFYNG